MGGSLAGKRFGNYIAFELIGRGGMGSVYVAEHPEIGRKVAIKALTKHHDEVMVQRFLDEAKAVTKIGHPNIIDIYDFGRTDSGRLYYVMEYLPGRELKAVIEEKIIMTAFEVQPYLEQICEAIQAAHECGVIHRDLKPANVFVLDEVPIRLKVLDFGVAKLLDTPQQDNVTCPGLMVGTPMYSAPEQAAAELDRICPQTDLYSLGIIMYRMLTGKFPFIADNSTVLLAMHITDKPRPIREHSPSVPPEIAALVEKCLEKDPADRPASASDLADRFARALNKVVSSSSDSEVAYDDGPSGIMVFVPTDPIKEIRDKPEFTPISSAGAGMESLQSSRDQPEVAVTLPMLNETLHEKTTKAGTDVAGVTKQQKYSREVPKVESDAAGETRQMKYSRELPSPNQTGPGTPIGTPPAVSLPGETPPNQTGPGMQIKPFSALAPEPLDPEPPAPSEERSGAPEEQPAAPADAGDEGRAAAPADADKAQPSEVKPSGQQEAPASGRKPAWAMGSAIRAAPVDPQAAQDPRETTDHSIEIVKAPESPGTSWMLWVAVLVIAAGAVAAALTFL